MGGGETCLTPKHGPEGERGRRAGTYRKGGSGTEADLLHGAEQQAAGGHAALAPRLGDGFTGGFGMGPPEPSSVPHRRPGGGQVLPQWEPGNASPPSLRPSVPPSFPPSLPPQRSQHPRIPASELVPRSHTLTGPSWTGKVGGGGTGGGQFSHPVPKGRQGCTPKKRGEHPPAALILLPKDVGPSPCPGGGTAFTSQLWGQEGRAEPPCLHLRGPPARREPQNTKGSQAPVPEKPWGRQDRSVQGSMGKLRHGAPRAQPRPPPVPPGMGMVPAGC